MAQTSISDNKKKIGRPATGVGQMVGVRFRPDQLAAVDTWSKEQEGDLSRPEAIRRLVQKALGES